MRHCIITKSSIICFYMLFLWSSGIAGAVEEQIDKKKVDISAPELSLPQPNYVFSQVVEGTEIIHNFIVLNKGKSMLKIKKIKPGWGCTTVSFTREIPPGGEGKIAIKVNTKGFGGRKLKKSIVIVSNDPENPTSKVIVSGDVKKFVTITPRFVRFNGKPGEELSAVVKIIPEKEFPFTIIKSKAKNGKLIQFQLDGLKKTDKTDKKGYLLTIQNLKKDPGIYFDTIILTTDSKIQPEISINIHARIVDPKVVKKQKGVSQNNPFLEMVKKMNAKNADSKHTHKADPAKTKDFKKKFEALIQQQKAQKE